MTLPDPTLISETKGFMDPDEGQRLYDLACEAGRQGPCLEIGSYCGLSTLYLGNGCRQAGAVLFAVDHHRGSEEHQPGEGYFDENLFDASSGLVDTFCFFRRTIARADLESIVVPIVSTSEIAARQWATPLSLVFIDGGHAFDTAWTDFSVWAPHLIPGGYLLIHDLFPDPADGGQAPYEVYCRARETNDYDELPGTGTLGVLRKKRN